MALRHLAIPSVLVVLAASVSSTVLSGCGAGAAARPADPTYAGTAGAETLQSGASCHDVGKTGSPLIVDWKPEDRGDLEEAMKKGVAVVHYDCNSFKLLGDCNPVGTYGFVGVTTKEQVISLANADEAKANLPLNGGTIGASISRGATLDIALIEIGKKSSQNYALGKDLLTTAGKCEGATHFVRAATLGAFAMNTGTAGNVQAAAAVFGVGAGASSTSTKAAMNKDGDPESCKSADPDSDTPPKQCRSLVQIQLVAFDDAGQTAKAPMLSTGTSAGSKDDPKDIVAPPPDLSCPDGLVAVQGKCAPAVASVAHQCKIGDATDCDAQCTAGDLTSCARLGYLYDWGATGIKEDDVKAKALYKKACDGGIQEGCNGLGQALQYDDDNYAAAATLYKGACLAGFADACNNLGTLYEGGKGVTKDKAIAVKLEQRACNAGATEGCWAMAMHYEDGDGVAQDATKALSYWDRSCGGGSLSARNCWVAGDRYRTGDKPFPKDPAKADALYSRGCDFGEWTACTELAEAYEKGSGVTADAAMAQTFHKRSCDMNAKSRSCKKVK